MSDMTDTTILSFLIDRLKSAGPKQWGELSRQVSGDLKRGDPGHVSPTMLRKIVYGERKNPGLIVVQRLLDHFNRSAVPADQIRSPATSTPGA